jgi:GntR family transcriptional regulator/MocR family aminotransferase
MPVARRYALLDWALKNRSIIIEDDYNSELRYAGRPVPSLQGLDSNGLVVYLGSFSSTLFPSVKISYMVLPVSMHQLFLEVVGGYTQTCSKAEQLTLAYYMEKGYYQTGLKKLRKLYTQKIQIASAEIQQYASSQVTILSNTSGLHLLLELKERLSGEAVEAICQRAKQVGLSVSPIADYQESSRNPLLIFYYAKVPTNLMTEAIKALAKALSGTSNHKDLE